MVGINSFFHSDLVYHPKKKLMNLIWAGAARNTAVSFLAYFSAVYIYKLFENIGKSSKESLYYVLLFYLILHVVKIITFSLSEDLSRKIGFRSSIIFSLVPFIILTIFYIASPLNPYLIFFAAAFWGIHAGLYWWGYHGYFIKSGDAKHFGAGLGELDMIITLAAVVAPVVGAFVINQFGFNYVFMLSLIFMFLAIVLLGSGKNLRQRHDVYFKDVVGLLLKHKSITLAYVSGGIESTFYLVGWALFLYFFFNGVLGLGLVVSVSLLLSAIFGMFIGSRIDKSGEHKIVAAGSPLFSVSWILRAFFSAPFMYVIADSFRFFSDKMVTLPLLKISYRKGVEDYVAKSILFRELALGIGAIVALLLILIFVSLELDYIIQFTIVALVSLLPLIAIVRKRI